MTNISTLGQALDQLERLKNLQGQMSDLQEQLATGKKTHEFKGLGGGLIPSERSRAVIQSLETYDTNITTATTRMNIMANSLAEIKAQANNLSGALMLQPQEGDYNFGSIGSQAENAQSFINTLINSQDGSRYVFSGASTTTQPLTDNGTLDTYEQTQLTKWANGTITTAQLIQSYQDPTQMTDSIMGYSPQIQNGNAKNVYVQADTNADLDYTVTGNDASLRTIVATVSMIKNISKVLDKTTSDPSDPPGTVTPPGGSPAAQQANFYQLFDDLSATLNKAIDSLDTDSMKIANVQAQIKQISADHLTEKNTLQGTISDVEDADMNETAVKVNQVQTQLEASYQVTAKTSQLSLVNFL